MVRLSVNINKIATLRNARGGNVPDLLKLAVDIEKFGAQGITVHPRPDERHIRYGDVFSLRPLIKTEFNIEGYPSQFFMDLVIRAKADQVTLVPDGPDVLTSNAGWDTKTHLHQLTEIVSELKKHNIRTSIFVEPDPEQIEGAAKTGTDRIELYTESYAKNYAANKKSAAQPFVNAAAIAESNGLSVNAGHDLNLLNLRYFKSMVPQLKEVSIGHALISDALYFGMENTIQMYLRELN